MSMTGSIRVLVAAEGSGGHLIPALEMSRVLAGFGAQVTLLYACRKPTAPLLQQLIHDARIDGVQTAPLRLRSVGGAQRWIQRLWQAVWIWRLTRERLKTLAPHVVVGFGGWWSVPVILAARQQGIPVLIHEQNVRLGRANRLLIRRHWVDQAAVSFESTRQELNGTPAVVTGLPIRRVIGMARREDAARQFHLDPQRQTVLVLGGSQGSKPVNHLVQQTLGLLSREERDAWQFIHLTGAADSTEIQRAYAAAGVRAWVAPHLLEMAWAYALADIVVARAGASTIAELARCGMPSILVPYPYAAGHQRDNAALVESAGAGVQLEEAAATPPRLHSLLWQLFANQGLRQTMGERMRSLAKPEATYHLASAVIGMAQVPAERAASGVPALEKRNEACLRYT